MNPFVILHQQHQTIIELVQLLLRLNNNDEVRCCAEYKELFEQLQHTARTHFVLEEHLLYHELVMDQRYPTILALAAAYQNSSAALKNHLKNCAHDPALMSRTEIDELLNLILARIHIEEQDFIPLIEKNLYY
jgi:hemerythrin